MPMTVRVEKSSIQVPYAGNLKWAIDVEFEAAESKRYRILVEASDLNRWFRAAVGRYPVGADDLRRREDLLANWDRFEPFLSNELGRMAP